MKVVEVFNKCKCLLEKNSPTILTGLAVAGVVTTVVLAVKATPEAVEILEATKADKAYDNDGDDKLTVLEVVECTWRSYAPAAVTGVVTIACIIGANHVNLKRNAAIASLATLYQTNFEEYKEKVKKKIGEKKESDIRYEVDQERLDKYPIDKNVTHNEGGGPVRCFDPMSGRYFWSDIETLRHAQNEFNQLLVLEGRESLNTLYGFMNLETTSLGEEVGWTPDHLMEFSFNSRLTSKGEPVMVVDYAVPPTTSYRDW